MNVVYTDYMGSERAISVQDAVARECDGSDYERGALEATQAEAENITRVLGELINALADRGVLRPEVELVAILGGHYEVQK